LNHASTSASIRTVIGFFRGRYKSPIFMACNFDCGTGIDRLNPDCTALVLRLPFARRAGAFALLRFCFFITPSSHCTY
jgi:hypothetical protein